jgi:endonuclease III
MTNTQNITATYWTAEDIAAMSDEQLDNFIAICRSGESLCFSTRNAKNMRRYSFLLERLAYPEQDRRRAAA